MFLNWLRQPFGFFRNGDSDPFVGKVTVKRPVHPIDAFIIGGWTLILIKCVLASVAIWYWKIPIGHFYIWGPSLIFGGVCTTLYLTREED